MNSAQKSSCETWCGLVRSLSIGCLCQASSQLSITLARLVCSLLRVRSHAAFLGKMPSYALYCHLPMLSHTHSHTLTPPGLLSLSFDPSISLTPACAYLCPSCQCHHQKFLTRDYSVDFGSLLYFLFPTFFFSILRLYFTCVCMHGYPIAYMWKEIRGQIRRESWFSPFTTWVLGIELRLLGLAATGFACCAT